MDFGAMWQVDEMAEELDVVAVTVVARDAEARTARTADLTRLDALRRSHGDLDATFRQRLIPAAARHQFVARQTAVAERRVA